MSVYVPKGLRKLWSKAFLAKIVETRDKNRAVTRKRCRAFPERVSPRTLSLESIDYIGTREYFSGKASLELGRKEHDYDLLYNNTIDFTQ